MQGRADIMKTDTHGKAEAERKTKGVGCKFFGSILLFTGLLNSLVAFKSGLSRGRVDNALLISGAALLIIGSLRK